MQTRVRMRYEATTMEEREFSVSEAPSVPEFAAPEERIMKPRRAAPADVVRPTRAEVSLDALRCNLHAIRQKAAGAKVWAVLKADAYGHGAPAVARTLERAKVDGFCVALVEEGVELREAGITGPILVMGGYYGRAYEEMLARRLTPVVYDREHLETFARLVRARGGEPLAVHLKVDTGMARLGVRPEEIPAFAEALAAHPELRVEGLMTHLASADATTTESLEHQQSRFEATSKTLALLGIRPTYRHAANSAALLREMARYDAVRPGIALFGVAPTIDGVSMAAGSGRDADLVPSLRVRSEIIALRDVPAGEPVGYSGLFRTSRPSRIATVAMGYADGLARALTNRGAFLVGGKRAPVAGAVSMDMTMIDVTDHPGTTLGDEVVILGRQEGPFGRDEITLDELAAHAGTISWEVLTHLSRRVPRFYREA